MKIFSKQIALAFLAVVAGLGALGALGYSLLAPSEADVRLTDAELAKGEALYMEYCASCHGADLEGQDNWRERRADGRLPAPPHDESGHTWHHPDSQLFAITKHGTAAFAPEGYKTDMRGFSDVMSDEEIRLVLDWIKAQWPEDIRERQAEITRRAGG